jgi:hypothetical protein
MVLLLIYAVVFAYAVWMDKYYGDGFLYLMISLIFVALADIYYEVGRKLSGAYMIVVAILLVLGVVV